MLRRTAWLALLAVFVAPAARGALETPEEIEACLQENLPTKTSVQTVSLRALDRVGAVTESRARVYWQREDDGFMRVMMRIQAPPDMRGAGLLVEERDEGSDMFMYLPELARVRRVTSRMAATSMFGTDISYEQFERIQGLSPRNVDTTRAADDTIGGRPVYVLDAVPKETRGSAFEKIRTFVDVETCMPLRIDYYEAGEVRKRLEADLARMTQEDGSHITRRLVMNDLRDQTSTELLIESIEIGEPIERHVFSKSYLESGRD